jgi:hypothetical protein
MSSFYITDYGDTLVQSNGTNKLPEDFKIEQTNEVIFIGYTIQPINTILLYKSKRYGTLYCTTKEKYPLIKNDSLIGSCCVTFVEKNNTIFIVLVQVKTRKYLMSPAGFSEFGESVQNSAIRETKEETGLTIENLNLLAIWER